MALRMRSNVERQRIWDTFAAVLRSSDANQGFVFGGQSGIHHEEVFLEGPRMLQDHVGHTIHDPRHDSKRGFNFTQYILSQHSSSSFIRWGP